METYTCEKFKEFEELNKEELTIVKNAYKEWLKEHAEMPFKEKSYYRNCKEKFNFKMESKTEYQKVKLEDMKLSEEIKKYGKMTKRNIKCPLPVFMSRIPYRGFRIILDHPIAEKEHESYYYDLSKYGWWNFCAQKDKMDSLDKEILVINVTKYGQYREGQQHSFCNDNMKAGKHWYNLHPNDMVKGIKKQIDKFYKDKENAIQNKKKEDK